MLKILRSFGWLVCPSQQIQKLVRTRVRRRCVYGSADDILSQLGLFDWESVIRMM